MIRVVGSISVLILGATLLFQNCGQDFKTLSVSENSIFKKSYCTEESIPEYRASLLTKIEMGYVLTDLFPTEIAGDSNILKTVSQISEISVDKLTDQTSYSENNPATMASDIYLSQLIDISDLLFEQYVKGASYRNNCISAKDQYSCLEFLLSDVVEKLWRRPVIEEEFELFLSIFSGSESLQKKANILFISALTSPQFYLKNYLPIRSGNKILEYSQYSLASRLSFFLYNSVPDRELLLAASEGRLVNASDILSQVDRILDQEKFAKRFVHHTLAPWLGIAKDLTSTEVVTNDHNVVLSVKDMANSQYLTLFELLNNNGPLSEIFYGSGVYMNNAMATYSDKGVKFSSDKTFTRVPASAQRGIIPSYFTSPHFTKNTMKSTDSVKTLVSARGIYIAEHFLCTDIPVNEVSPEDVVRVLGKNAASLKQTQVGEIRRKHSSCMGCHGEVDKLGMGVEYVDSFGRLRSTYSDSTPISFSFKLNEQMSEPVTSLNGFLSALSIDPRLHSCFLKTVANKVAPLRTTSEQPCLSNILSANPNQGIRDYVKGIISSSLFTKAMRYRNE